MNRESHPNWVPNDLMGSRKETAVLLVGTAREFDIPQREIASTQGGFYITDRLADVVYDEDDDKVSGNSEAEPESDPAPKKASKKTSGNRAAKTDSQEGE